MFGELKFDSAHAKADNVLLQCQIATVQFVFLRPLTSVMSALVKTFSGSNVSIFSPLHPQFYIMMIVNISVCVAFAGLLKFYHAAKVSQINNFLFEQREGLQLTQMKFYGTTN